jgi:outer membrane protein assembly factor BamB
MPRSPALTLTAASCLFPLLAAGWCRGADWPQVLGPTRNGIAAMEERLADRWPASGPALIWERPVGSGFAGVAVGQERVILFHREGDAEVVESLDARTRQPLWKDAWPTRFMPQFGATDGPLCVPTIQDGKVVLYGAQGVLACYDLATGKRLWLHETHREFDAAEGYFGAGSSPLIESGRVIVNVGGRDQKASLVAFALEGGEVLWKAVADDASYSSPVAATVGGSRTVIALTRLKCVALDPATGAVQFEFPFGKRGPTVTAANPLVVGGHLFLTASYGIGSVWARLEKQNAKEVWSSTEVLASQYTTCVEHEGLLYGVDGRQDIPPADLKCFDPRTQTVRWTQPNFGYATLIKADGKLVIQKTDGTLVLAALRPDKYQSLASSRVLSGTVRALPALAGGRLYVRNENRLKCLDLAP